MISYWIKQNGSGAYCEGDLPDGAYDESTCILVSKKPSVAHKWNNEIQEWTIALEDQKNYIRGIRNIELRRTDKFILSDYYAEFTEEQQGQISTYRQALRDVPDHETVETIVMPDCPEFMN